MLNRRVLMRAAGSLPLAWSATVAQAALAQGPTFPAKPVTLVLPFGPGNAADTIGRLLAQHMGNSLGQQVIIENRPGAGGVGAVKQVAAAKPDGHTLLYIGAGVAISQGLFKPQPYDMLASFTPISIVSSNDVLLLIRKDSRLTQLKDFIHSAREKKGQCMVGVSLLGTTQHLCAELFKQRAKVDFTIVPFKTAAAVATALAAGDIDLGFEFVPPTLALVKSGQLRALAIANAKRSEALHEVPTIAEQGLAGFNVASWGMIVAPAHTPDAIVQRLNREVQRVLEQTDMAKRLADIGVRAPGGTTAQAYELLSNEIVRWRHVIQEAKIALK